MLIVGEARCAACGHDHKLTRTGVWMVCGYCLCDEQKFSARNAAREPSVTMVEPPELSADARLLLERAWTRTGEVIDGSESTGGVEETSEGHAELGAAKVVDDDAHRNGLTAETGDVAPATSVECTTRLNTRAGIKPGPALSLPPNDVPQAVTVMAGLPRASAAADKAAGRWLEPQRNRPSSCSLVAILERRGYFFWNCACGREARIGMMLEGTARNAWARHAKEQ